MLYHPIPETIYAYIPEENHQTLFDNRKHIKMSFGGPLNVGRQCEQRAPHIGHRLVPPVFRPCINAEDDCDGDVENKRLKYILHIGMHTRIYVFLGRYLHECVYI